MEVYNLKIHLAEEKEKPVFSILIPSWNNLSYLKLCIESIRKNSFYHHQIIVHANEATDGTLDWLKENKISYTHSEHNIGVCYSHNSAYSLAISDYICLMDDDVYVCPDWDKPLWDDIQQRENEFFCVSGTLIEPIISRNKSIIQAYDFGRTPDTFDEKALLKQYNKIPFYDWNGCNWYPLIIHRRIWNLIGGLSIEFSPGMYSDPDFMIKLWYMGIRYYKGISASRSYHFLSRTTSRVKRNNGRKQFLLKWGISNSTFKKYYIKMDTVFSGNVPEPKMTIALRIALLRDRLKRIIS